MQTHATGAAGRAGSPVWNHGCKIGPKRALKPKEVWAIRRPGPRAVISGWVRDHNTARPHSSLGYLTPAAFAATLHPQRASTLRHMKSSAPTPVAHGPGARNSQSAIPVAAG